MSHFSQHYLANHRVADLQAEAARERLVRTSREGRATRPTGDREARRHGRPGPRAILTGFVATAIAVLGARG